MNNLKIIKETILIIIFLLPLTVSAKIPHETTLEIKKSARNAIDIYKSEGLSGLISKSMSCYKDKIEASLYCVNLDIAANYIDRTMSQSMKMPQHDFYSSDNFLGRVGEVFIKSNYTMDQSNRYLMETEDLIAAEIDQYLTNINSFQRDPADLFTHITIGKTDLKIKTPNGFIETSSKSKELWSTAKSLDIGTSETKAHYITIEDYKAYSRSRNGNFERYFSIQTPKSLVNNISSQKQFNDIRSSMSNMQNISMQNVESRLNEFTSKIGSEYSADIGNPFSLQIGQIVPVSVNVNTDNYISYTMLAQVSTSNENSNESNTLVMTSGLILIKGKVISVNYYKKLTQSADLNESRAFINNVVSSIFESNP